MKLKAKHIKRLRAKIHFNRHSACQFCIPPIEPIECEIYAGLYCKKCGSRVEFHKN